MNSPSKRYLGLELAGAKNDKTSLAAIEFYAKEKKTFLLDIFDRISAQPNETGDEALLAIIGEINSGVSKIGVNVPLVLPPCITCTRKSCPLPEACTVSAVAWSHKIEDPKGRPFTPYTQRPVERWIRNSVFPHLPESHRFEIDETLGGNRAPLTARMHFLKKHLTPFSLVEVWPKMTMSVLGLQLQIPKRIIMTYRNLEDGSHSREVILTRLAEHFELFIYERDLRKLSQSLAAFDAFICALTALLSDQNLCAKMPQGFPSSSGWIQYPKV